MQPSCSPCAHGGGGRGQSAAPTKRSGRCSTTDRITRAQAACKEQAGPAPLSPTSRAPAQSGGCRRSAPPAPCWPQSSHLPAPRCGAPAAPWAGGGQGGRCGQGRAEAPVRAGSGGDRALGGSWRQPLCSGVVSGRVLHSASCASTQKGALEGCAAPRGRSPPLFPNRLATALLDKAMEHTGWPHACAGRPAAADSSRGRRRQRAGASWRRQRAHKHETEPTSRRPSICTGSECAHATLDVCLPAARWAGKATAAPVGGCRSVSRTGRMPRALLAACRAWAGLPSRPAPLYSHLGSRTVFRHGGEAQVVTGARGKAGPQRWC